MFLFHSYDTGWKFVDSSNLEAVRYDPASSTLYIRFQSDSVYAYYGVPPEIHQGLMSAESKGHYHHRHIRKEYPYERIS